MTRTTSVLGRARPESPSAFGCGRGVAADGTGWRVESGCGLVRHRDRLSRVVVAGAAGVGKSWSALEVLVAAEQRGVLTWWAVATESARVLPLGTFAAGLGVVVRIRLDWCVSPVEVLGLVEVYPDGRKLQAWLTRCSVRCNGRSSAYGTLGGGAVESPARWAPPVAAGPITLCVRRY
jgi:hypothetical protein